MGEIGGGVQSCVKLRFRTRGSLSACDKVVRFSHQTDNEKCGRVLLDQKFSRPTAAISSLSGLAAAYREHTAQWCDSHHSDIVTARQALVRVDRVEIMQMHTPSEAPRAVSRARGPFGICSAGLCVASGQKDARLFKSRHRSWCSQKIIRPSSAFLPKG